MAEVFRARLCGPSGFEKMVALKMILPHISHEPSFVAMFVHEATLAASLDHANIVRIQEFDRIDDRHYIAMELVDGRDLRALLGRCKTLGRKLSVAECLTIGLALARALAFAHGELTGSSQVVIHRDVSPHNLMISRAGEVKLTDFGIAKVQDSISLTQTGLIKGKFSYMSPEQMRGDTLTPKTDLFSAGIVLWELLCQRKLFRNRPDSDQSLAQQVQNKVIVAPSTLNPGVSPALDQIVLAALERDHSARTASASGLADALSAELVRQGGEADLGALYREVFEVPAPRHTALAPAISPAPALSRVRTERAQAAGAKPPEESSEPTGSCIELDLSDLSLVSDEAQAEALEPEPEHLGQTRAYSPGEKPTLVGFQPADAITRQAEMPVPPPLPQGRAKAAARTRTTQAVESPFHRLQPERPVARAREQSGSALSKPRPKRLLLLSSCSVGAVALVVALVLALRLPMVEQAQAKDLSDPQKVTLSGAACGQGHGGPTSESATPAERKKTALEDKPPAPTGTINVSAIPWARVYAGGKYIGETPITGYRMPVGSHSLLLVNKERAARKRVRVVIRKGQSATVVVGME